MKKIIHKVLLMCLLGVYINSNAQKQNTNILIETNFGNMKIMLYKDTPLHRKNFLQLLENKHFDGTLFYRVIKNFVIQGGSQDSRNARKGADIGYGYSNRTIQSEFKKKYFHKKGALAAPRQPDRANIFKESDVSQFYIVHGRVYSIKELEYMERKINKPIRKKIVKKFLTDKKRKILADLKKDGKVKEFRLLADKVKADIDFEYNSSTKKLEFTDEQKLAYSTIGGVPHLDNDYTVFGEVISGFNVINKIAKLRTSAKNRPLTDVKIKIKILNY